MRKITELQWMFSGEESYEEKKITNKEPARRRNVKNRSGAHRKIFAHVVVVVIVSRSLPVMTGDRERERERERREREREREKSTSYACSIIRDGVARAEILVGIQLDSDWVYLLQLGI